ncbi:MAG: ABC transporter permease [Treponema sp.]|uniref:ABC transporter permease n=1 Tax=Treponema sp. TaxID=166 RepID=UPI0025D842E3|nr:ABC transporter permease [Treponema sp.]MBQ8678624.1 ABC transporter permease [Treponema sp.]MBR1403766.1 ABC transporter permease [Treponema sp.]
MNILSILGAAQGAVAQGLLWGIMTLGVYLTFRILNIADMTCDGSFALGGSTCAILVTKGMNPLFAVLIAFFTGLVAGLATGLMHTKLKIHEILAGILSMIALYSINIRIMGKSNTPLLGVQTIMTNMQDRFGITPNIASFIVGVIFGIVLIVLLYWFCGTELGSCIRATGNNEKMVRAMGVDTDKMKLLGLMLSNGLIALSGALVAQQQGYGDVGMGTGAIVIGLASIILGESIFAWFNKRFAFYVTLLSILLGSVVYRLIIAIVLQLGLKSSDLKLLTAIIVVIALAIPVAKKKVLKKKVAVSVAKEGK